MGVKKLQTKEIVMVGAIPNGSNFNKKEQLGGTSEILKD